MRNLRPIFGSCRCPFLMKDAMKKVTKCLILGGSVLLLGGCANWPSARGYVDVVDQQKIELIEKWARTNNTQVIWITAPVRKVRAAGT